MTDAEQLARHWLPQRQPIHETWAQLECSGCLQESRLVETFSRLKQAFWSGYIPEAAANAEVRRFARCPNPSTAPDQIKNVVNDRNLIVSDNERVQALRGQASPGSRP